MKKVVIVGLGPGNLDMLTPRGREELLRCDCLIGAQRMLDEFDVPPVHLCLSAPTEIRDRLRENPDFQRVGVVVSGDVGFYSLAKGLLPLLEEEGYEVSCIPGIGSLSYFCAKLGVSWEDAAILSLHGREGQLVGTVLNSSKTFLLCGGKNTVSLICETLARAGFGGLRICVGENLSYLQERIFTGDLAETLGESFEGLCVLLIQNPQPLRQSLRIQGLPDTCFLRGSYANGQPIPMTKSEVRSAVLSKLRLRQDSTGYDIGAATGSVSVEMALQANWGTVYAIERDVDALELLQKNRERFGVLNLQPVLATAPDGLQELPPADAVFVGGCAGHLPEILQAVLEKNPRVRLVISAVTVETLYQATAWVEAAGLPQVEIISLSVSRGRRVGASHLLQAQNTVYLISAGGEELAV